MALVPPADLPGQTYIRTSGGEEDEDNHYIYHSRVKEGQHGEEFHDAGLITESVHDVGLIIETCTM